MLERENVLRIYIPYNLLTEPSGVILGSWSDDRTVACVTHLDPPAKLVNALERTYPCVLGLWDTSLESFESSERHFDSRHLQRILMNDTQKHWILLEKQDSYLPTCTVSDQEYSFSGVVVIVFDAVKVKQSHYLMNSAHNHCTGNGVQKGSIGNGANSTNMEVLADMLSESEKIQLGDESKSLVTDTKGFLSLVGSTLEFLSFCFIKIHHAVSALFDNR